MKTPSFRYRFVFFKLLWLKLLSKKKKRRAEGKQAKTTRCTISVNRKKSNAFIYLLFKSKSFSSVDANSLHLDETDFDYSRFADVGI